MSATIAGVPRVKPTKRLRARPLEPTVKRDLSRKKKEKAAAEVVDDLTLAWRRK